MINFLNNKKSIIGVILLTLLEVLLNTETISIGVYGWLLPLAQGVLGIGLVDKVRKFTKKGKSDD